MLNISQTELVKRLDLINYKSGQRVLERRHYKYFNRFLTGAAIACVVILFLPWTQNVTGNGYVTTLTPDQRPQTIQSPIPGRIEQWHVREGDYVAKGDTILRISEIKNEYFDPNLVKRTGQQIDAKTMSVSSYGEKVKALDNQIAALAQERELKFEQGRNKLMQSRLKVTTDSIDYIAAQTNLKIAETQLQRAQTLNDEA
ncbi:RND efflux membrane fusion protein [Nonlabens ulvanivorans]|nr:RND efflux membrane fusion protein [Nonlabens ulvanivorans]